MYYNIDSEFNLRPGFGKSNKRCWGDILAFQVTFGMVFGHVRGPESFYVLSMIRLLATVCVYVFKTRVYVHIFKS